MHVGRAVRSQGIGRYRQLPVGTVGHVQEHRFAIPTAGITGIQDAAGAVIDGAGDQHRGLADSAGWIGQQGIGNSIEVSERRRQQRGILGMTDDVGHGRTIV